jgi:hypothetical protein
MQDIYTCIPETNHVPREHRVAVILMLLFMVLISLVPALTSLYLHVSNFRSMCAVTNMDVFCSSLTSWFPGMLLTYFLNHFEMVPVAPIITGITFVFTLQMRCIIIIIIIILYIKLFVRLYLIQIHISEPIWTKLCTHIPLGLKETVGYVWFENVWPFLPSWPFSSVASAESSTRNGCWRKSSATALYTRFLLLLVWRHGNDVVADDIFAFCKSHPRQRYIRDSSGVSVTSRKWRCSRRQFRVLTASVVHYG